MNETNNNSYNLLSKLIHWITALLILGLLAVGFYMTELDKSTFKYELYDLHKALGAVVIALTFLRILWHVMKRKPKSLHSHKAWEKAISHLTHALLYLAILVVPLSGWAMSSSGGYAVSFFGLFDLPALVQKDKDMSELFGEIHEISSIALLLLIGVHMLGAFKHHFVDKDETLQRMTAKSLGLIGGIIVLLLAVAAYTPAGFYMAQEMLDIEAEEPHDDDDHEH